MPLTALTNLALDIALVPSMGAAGAAWATSASLYVNALTLTAMWRRKMATLPEANVLLARPTGPEARALISFAAPMMVALCARVYMGLSVTLSAVALGTASLAANQVIECLYWLFCPFGEAVSLALQAYLPPLLLQGRALARRLQRSALRAAAGLGLVAALGAVAVPLAAPGIFTTSSEVAAIMGRSAPALGFTLLAYVLACTTEGMLIARRNLRYLASMHALNTIGLCAALGTIVRMPGAGLQHVWMGFGLVNVARFLEFTYGIKRADIEAISDKGKWRRDLRRKLQIRVLSVRRRGRPASGVDEAIPDIAGLHPHLLN